MNSAFMLAPILLVITLTICISSAVEPAAGERMPLWDRIALSDVRLYMAEDRVQEESMPPAKKGTWARFIKRSEKYHTELVELEGGGQYWTDIPGFYPLYYVVEKGDLIVQVEHGISKKPTDELDWSGEVIAHPGDIVAVDRWSQALAGTWLVYTPDGSRMGYAPSNRLQPVGDSGMGLAGE